MKKIAAIKMMEAKLECLTRASSALDNCMHDCEDCRLCYEQGNIGEQKECLRMAIKSMKEGNNDTINNI